MSKRAFDKFIGSPRNLTGSKPSLEEQTAHGEEWTLTPGCKGSVWARRGYHHTKACKARKREFLLTEARSEELRASRLERNLRVQQNLQVQRDLLALHERKEYKPEPVDEQPQPLPDVEDSGVAASTETPDAEATRRTRILTKRSDPAVVNPTHSR